MASTYQVTDYFPAQDILNSALFTHLDEIEAQAPGALVYCQNIHYLHKALAAVNVACILCPDNLRDEVLDTEKTIVFCVDPRTSFFRLYNRFNQDAGCAILPPPIIGDNCRLHPSAVISPLARLGNNVEVSANVVIEGPVEIGDNVFIGSNAVVGAEGLITLRNDDGTLMMVKHQGGVRIGSGCQILAGAVIARSLFQRPTTIHDNCQIGIMSNIGHGAVIGENCVVSGNTVIAGRSRLGAGVWVGASCSIAQGLVIGDAVQIKMGSVVISDVAPGSVVSGNFAINHRANMTAHLRKLK
ncbi:DapH/DapD/GlmU-related protein [Pseudomonas fluorescens]|jgi:UDP-3-O-[3-hydroxymyristoyl] glucosamine N-acyltransferase|uniref:DapH/DapD/GlmU-related protein n=1 Tax=Pseudomonas fluorescens TaxID=294 RepID=UPI002781DEFD|nr:DapH/DapD/GlmU-related protein [Pseudomonas fluorescens]MDP9781237.1 UDP-3-O-[3-hydroxymyristoyl] glucosamine N-acyltransferase [Pseudomonas fluorescens]